VTAWRTLVIAVAFAGVGDSARQSVRIAGAAAGVRIDASADMQ
jgi:hypothetical protein